MKDPQGLPVIQALLKSAESGEGFQRYAWNKPSSGQVTDKLAYVVMLDRSEEHTSELQSLMRISYAVFCLKKKKNTKQHHTTSTITSKYISVSLKTIVQYQ